MKTPAKIALGLALAWLWSKKSTAAAPGAVSFYPLGRSAPQAMPQAASDPGLPDGLFSATAFNPDLSGSWGSSPAPADQQQANTDAAKAIAASPVNTITGAGVTPADDSGDLIQLPFPLVEQGIVAIV